LDFDPERQELLDALAGKRQGRLNDEDDVLAEPDLSSAGVLDAMEADISIYNRLYRLVQGRVPVERLRYWLVHPSPFLQRHALAQLSRDSFDEVRAQLLESLDSDDEQLARLAHDSLATPAVATWYFANFQTLTQEQRHKIAEGFGRSWIDFGDHREAIYSAIAETDDCELASKLLRAVNGFRNWQQADVIRLGALCNVFDLAAWKLEIISTLSMLDSPGLGLEIASVVRGLLHHECEYVRAAALRALPNCRQEIESIRTMWTDTSVIVRCESLWKLMECDPSAPEFLKHQLATESTDRLAMEILWCLAAQQQLPDHFSASCLERMPLSANLLAAVA
jgi:hypothetical protein